MQKTANRTNVLSELSDNAVCWMSRAWHMDKLPGGKSALCLYSTLIHLLQICVLLALSSYEV